MKYLCFLMTITTMLSTVAAAQHVPDVNGVAIGMTLAEAKTKIGSSYHFVPSTFQDPQITALIAWKEGDGWLFEAIGGKIALVQETRFFSPANRPNAADIDRRLEEKYGKRQQSVYWALGPNGLPLPQNDPNANACSESGLAGGPETGIQDPDFKRQFGTRFNYSSGWNAACSYSISGYYAPADGMLEVKLVDNRPFYAAAVRWQKHLQDVKNQELERQKKNVPPM